MVVQSWTDVVVGSLQNLWWGVVNYLPNIIGALVVLIIGLIVAAGFGRSWRRSWKGFASNVFSRRSG